MALSNSQLEGQSMKDTSTYSSLKILTEKADFFKLLIPSWTHQNTLDTAELDTSFLGTELLFLNA